MVQCAVPVYSVRQENKSEFIYENTKSSFLNGYA